MRIYTALPAALIADVTAGTMPVPARVLMDQTNRSEGSAPAPYAEDPLIVIPDLYHLTDDSGTTRLVETLDTRKNSESVDCVLWEAPRNGHMLVCRFDDLRGF